MKPVMFRVNCCRGPRRPSPPVLLPPRTAKADANAGANAASGWTAKSCRPRARIRLDQRLQCRPRTGAGFRLVEGP